MALIPIFEIGNIVTYKSVDKNVNNDSQRYYRIEHAGHKSKSGLPVRLYSTSGTVFLLFVQQTCQNIARMCSTHILLVH